MISDFQLDLADIKSGAGLVFLLSVDIDIARHYDGFCLFSGRSIPLLYQNHIQSFFHLRLLIIYNLSRIFSVMLSASNPISFFKSSTFPCST